MTKATHTAYNPETVVDGLYISIPASVMTNIHFVTVYCAPGSGPNHRVLTSRLQTITINAYSYIVKRHAW